MGKGIGRIIALTVLPFLPLSVDAADRTLDCSTGTIQNFLPRLRPGDTLFVSGICDENVSISGRYSSITLDGQGSATINGTDSNSNTVNISGRRITIKGFTITGGSRGVLVNRGAEATIDGNTIQATGGEGIELFNGASARILNNVIQNNPSHGILVTGTSVADIGITSGGQTVADTNTIQNNGNNGIIVNRGSSARIKGNIISNNTSAGIRVADNSTADTASNTIDGNNDAGINVQRNSVVRLGRDGGTTLQDAPNSTTVNNTGYGIRCRLSGVVDGQLGTLNGTAGAADIVGFCTDSTIP